MYREKTFGVAGKSGRSGGFSSVRGFFRKAETVGMIGIKEIWPISSKTENSSKQEEGQTHGGHIIEKYNIPNGA